MAQVKAVIKKNNICSCDGIFKIMTTSLHFYKTLRTTGVSTDL